MSKKRKNRKPSEVKTQTSRDKYLESTIQFNEGMGRFGEKPPPFNFRTAMEEYRSWPGAAINLNAKAVASVPIKLYARQAESGKNYRWKTRSVDPKDLESAYLLGKTNNKPSKSVMRAAKSFNEEGFVEVEESGGRRIGILELLHDANNFFNGFDLIQLLTIHLETTGNAYLHPIIDPMSGVPSEIWPMPPHWVQIIPDRQGFIDGFVYGKSFETEQVFDTSEVIHFRQTASSTEGIHYGQGKMELGWDVVVLNKQMHQMDLAFIENGARPDYMILSKKGQKDQLDRLERKINKRHRGVQKTGRFMTLSGDVELIPMSFNPKDMTGRKELIDEIATVFGVPQTLLMANDPNLSNARQGFASWKAGTILPILTLIEQRLNEDLVPLYPDLAGNAFLAFENPVPEDREFELNETIQKVNSGIWTRAEARELDGKEEIEGSDELLVAGGVMPVDALAQQTGANPFFNLNASRTATQAVEGKSDPEKDIASLITKAAEAAAAQIKQAASDSLSQLDSAKASEIQQVVPVVKSPQIEVPKVKIYRQSDLLWPGDYFEMNIKQAEVGDADDDVREDQPVNLEDKLERQLRKVLADFGKAAIQILMDPSFKMSSMKHHRIKIEDPLVVRVLKQFENLNKEISKAIKVPITEMLIKSGSQGLKEIQTEVADFPYPEISFEVSNPLVADYVRNKIFKLAGEIEKTTINKVRNTIAAGLNIGKSYEEIADVIQETGIFGSARAKAIARTEGADAYIQGKKEGWRQSGVVSGYVWDQASHACQFCKAIGVKYAGRIMGLSGTEDGDSAFLKLGDTITGTEGGTFQVNLRDVKGPPLHPNCRCSLKSVRSGLYR